MCLGIPARVVALHDASRALATIEVGGMRRSVSLVCLVDAAHPPESWIGSWVLVHVGFAMVQVDEGEARRTLELLDRMGELQSELDALRDPHSTERS